MILHLRQARGLEEGRVRARAAGEEATELYPGRPWSEVEPHVAGDWRRVRGGSPLSWTDVRDDAHSGWQVAWLQQADCLRDNAPVND
ncbi:MAG TPA: hypothetical protein VFT52_10600 [Luteimonas sp.]|jgi:hypothetical protein|nr:hypothetical protein [Luteimonas sp.]